MVTPLDPQTLVRDHGPMLSRLARQFFRNGEEASDALQEAWIEVLKALPQFRGESSPRTWVYRVAWRRMLAHRNQERRETLGQLRHRYDLSRVHQPPAESGETRLWIESICQNCMTGVLHCLTADQRLAFLFRQIAKFEMAEVALILETTEANVRQLVHRARRILGRFLSEDCAHSGPEAHCRWGADDGVRQTGLHAAFERLGSFSSQVAAYRAADGIFPGKNEWERYLQTGELSQRPVPSP